MCKRGFEPLILKVNGIANRRINHSATCIEGWNGTRTHTQNFADTNNTIMLSNLKNYSKTILNFYFNHKI